MSISIEIVVLIYQFNALRLMCCIILLCAMIYSFKCTQTQALFEGKRAMRFANF